MRSPLRIYHDWKWRRFMVHWSAAREWAERVDAAMNELRQEQQDQLDAQLRDRLTP